MTTAVRSASSLRSRAGSLSLHAGGKAMARPSGAPLFLASSRLFLPGFEPSADLARLTNNCWLDPPIPPTPPIGSARSGRLFPESRPQPFWALGSRRRLAKWLFLKENSLGRADVKVNR